MPYGSSLLLNPYPESVIEEANPLELPLAIFGNQIRVTQPVRDTSHASGGMKCQDPINQVIHPALWKNRNRTGT